MVQEFGYDSDADDEFRYAVEDHCGTEIEDDDYTGGADAVLLWWRDGDGDLGDALVDMVGVLDDGGFVVLLTPKVSGDEVDPSDIDEAAITAGLHTAGTFNAAADWRAHKLVAIIIRIAVGAVYQTVTRWASSTPYQVWASNSASTMRLVTPLQSGAMIP